MNIIIIRHYNNNNRSAIITCFIFIYSSYAAENNYHHHNQSFKYPFEGDLFVAIVVKKRSSTKQTVLEIKIIFSV